MKRYFIFASLVLSFTSGGALAMWITRGTAAHAEATVAPAKPPESIVICGISEHPCVHYAVSFHQPTGKFGDRAGDGLTDYEAKTISVASSRDSYVNVSSLMHEVYHAVLWERGFTDKSRWTLHEWIYFSEGPTSMVLHDNPKLMQFIANGY